jgi:hypothetical protein
MRTKVIGTGIGVALLMGSLALFWFWNARPTVIRVDASPPADFPEHGFSHASFEQLLERFVQDGHVDYASWHGDADARHSLDQYLAAIAKFSPDNAPERFGDDHLVLAYWMYAYNAFVIKAILERWPLESVTDVKAPVEIVRGLGFFYTLQFVAGGELLRLHDLEHDKVIKPSRDPRVHFVLNCGSASCPILRPKLPTGDALDPFLESAARDFVAESRNVDIDHDARVVHLSKIFEWYEKDFVAEVRRRGLPSERGAITYVELVAAEGLVAELERARGYQVKFRDYDWAVNEVAR